MSTRKSGAAQDAEADKLPQIHPSISVELNDRLEEFARLYDAEKYWVVKVALQYGARHFKKAYQEYHDLRKGDYSDADDQAPEGAANVVPFAQPSEKAK